MPSCGRFRFWTMRPAHVHFMISAPGRETFVTHIFAVGDPYLDSDAVFEVKDAIIRPYLEHPAGPAPDGTEQAQPMPALATISG